MAPIRSRSATTRVPEPLASSRSRASQAVVLGHAANELVFAVVGHVGSGTTEIAKALQERLTESDLPGGPFQVTLLKAREVIDAWATTVGEAPPSTAKDTLTTVERYQDLGDMMRKNTNDHAAVAKHLAIKVRETRALQTGVSAAGTGPIMPDGRRRAYILDSIRHPAEVGLLRHIYQDAFILIGVVCEEHVRLARVTRHYKDAGEERAKQFMGRDARAKEKYGQRTSDAFQLSDFFIDNTLDRFTHDSHPQEENPEWDVNEKLSRLVKIVLHTEIVRPTTSERAMHHAYGAKMASACLSRQVGAALLDKEGNLIATGTNEVPRGGGGVYGQGFAETPEQSDQRCAFRATVYCSNTQEQNTIIDEIIAEIPQLQDIDPVTKIQTRKSLREGRIGDLLEFSRAYIDVMAASVSKSRADVNVRSYPKLPPNRGNRAVLEPVQVPTKADIEELNKRQLIFISHRSIASLLHKAWDLAISNRGLLPYQLSNQTTCWFFPDMLLPGNIATFTDYRRSERRRQLAGRSERYRASWHFGLAARPVITEPMRYCIRPHVVFSSDGKNLIDSKLAMHRLRRSFCRNWWNDRWRDMMMASMTYVAAGECKIKLHVGSSSSISVASIPMEMRAPVSFRYQERLEEPQDVALSEFLEDEILDFESPDWGDDEGEAEMDDLDDRP
jgi:deoxycytidylate deaminase